MSSLMIIWNCHWFQLVIANLIIKPYEIGLLSVLSIDLPVDKVIIDWNLTPHDSSNLNLHLGPTTIPFLIAGFLKLNYIVFLSTGLLIFSVERSVASYLLDDYESKSRNNLLIGLLISFYAISYGITTIWFFNPLDFYWVMVIFLTPSGVAVLLLFTSRRYNLQISRLIDNSTTRYTLPAKYQAKENIRFFRMMSKVISSVITFILLDSLIFFLLHWNLCPYEMQVLMNEVLENLLQLNPLVVNTILICSVPQWRKHTVFGRFLDKSNRRKNMVQSRPREEEDGRKNETEEYFKQLKNAWT